MDEIFENSQEEFDTSQLRKEKDPLPNDDPVLKEFVAKNGRLFINKSVIGMRPAVAGETVETWVNGPDGNKILERSTEAKEGDLVAVGVLGEQYIPSKAGVEKNRVQVGAEGLRSGETSPALPDDGNEYQLWRSNGDDVRLAVQNPLNEAIYLRTSSGRLQTGVPGGMIAAQLRPSSSEDVPGDIASRLDVARFIGPDEFAASYQEIPADNYFDYDVPPPLSE